MASVSSSEVIVGTVATVIFEADADGGSVAVSNVHSSTVHIGDAGVTVAAGFPVAAGGVMSLDVGPSVKIFAVSAVGTHPVRVLVAER